MKLARFGITMLVMVFAALIIWSMFPRSFTPPTFEDTPTEHSAPAESGAKAIDSTVAEPADWRRPSVITAPAQDAAATTPGQLPAGAAALEPMPSSVAPAASQAPAASKAIGRLRAQPAQTAELSQIGSTDKESGYQLWVQLTAWGAAIRQIHLSQYDTKVFDGEPYRIQNVSVGRAAEGRKTSYYPFAAKIIYVDGQAIDLQSQRWKKVNQGVYEIELVDPSGLAVVRIRRRYKVSKGESGYDIQCHQRIENLSDHPLQIAWKQNAFVDITPDQVKYMGERRILAAGYHDLDYDPARHAVYTKNTFLVRSKVHDRARESLLREENRRNRVLFHKTYDQIDPLWPSEDVPANAELVWLGALNRYFAVVVHQPMSDQADEDTPPPALESLFPDVGLELITPSDTKPNARKQPDRRKGQFGLVYTLKSNTMSVAPGAWIDLDLALFAGPRKPQLFKTEPYKRLGFKQNLIRYELGCTWFTFQPLAHALLWFLNFIHMGVRDWGIAIIILVAVVRTMLHPITKKSQVNMMKMGKRMQALQPELEKLKKKYKDDQKRLNQETMKLQMEKGLNPANLLGCLPMFLQMPIWIALYAMLFLAIELRHEPAFYGVFQAISGDKWLFLADLSAQDNFIPLPGSGFTMPLLGWTVTSINILPLLMAVIFFLQQKMTMTPAVNDQQKQQQKMMKWMTLLFPVFLYPAPCGLTLYILASTSAGIVDSYLVRKHIKEQEESGELLEKKERKSGGIMNRLSKALAERQKDMLERNKRLQGRSRPLPRRRPKKT